MPPTPRERLLLLWRAEQRDLWASLLALLLLGAGFLVLSDEVRSQATQHFDERVLLALRRADDIQVPVGPRWLAEAARDVTALGSVMVLALVVLAVAGFLVLVRRWRTLALVLVATVGGRR